jgi:hypothetical protein
MRLYWAFSRPPILVRSIHWHGADALAYAALALPAAAETWRYARREYVAQ